MVSGERTRLSAMRIRLSYLKDGELIAEAFADIPSGGDVANEGRIVVEDIRRLRPDVRLLDDSVTCYIEIMSSDDADRT
jgi:hypothetical protein